jgi:peptide-methionine (S)-S-oxide reductase
MKLIYILIFAPIFFSCAHNEVSVKKEFQPTLNLENYQTAYFASGCFWCVEAIFESVKGVAEVESGYSGGEIINPTYQQVSAGVTKHAEAVKVYYDSTIISYSTLLDVFFNSHDPTTLNQQGPDRGYQYRSAIFYQTEEEKELANSKVSELISQKVYPLITTQIVAFKAFYIAEDYHQDYEKNNPGNGYVQAVSIPRLNAFKRKMPAILK